MSQPLPDHEPRPPRADATRNRTRLVAASINVLADRPSASMDEIAAAAGLGRATLYRHFRTRGELVLEIQRSAIQDAAMALEEARLDEGPVAEALERAVTALIGIGDRYRLLGSQTGIDRDALAGTPAVAERLVALISRGQESGEIRTDLPVTWILPSLVSLMLLALTEMAAERLTPDQAARYVTSSLISGLEDAAGP